MRAYVRACAHVCVNGDERRRERACIYKVCLCVCVCVCACVCMCKRGVGGVVWACICLTCNAL